MMRMIWCILLASWRWCGLACRTLPHTDEWVGPIMAWHCAWGTARRRTRDWRKYEQALDLATGLTAPAGLRESLRLWWAQRRLMRRARSLAREYSWLSLCVRSAERRKRLNQFVQLHEYRADDGLYCELVTARWLLEEAERAVDLRKRAEECMKV